MHPEGFPCRVARPDQFSVNDVVIHKVCCPVIDSDNESVTIRTDSGEVFRIICDANAPVGGYVAIETCGKILRIDQENSLLYLSL